VLDPAGGLAAVFQAPRQPLTLERFPLPALAGSEVLVRVRCCTICGSDLHSYFGRRPSPAPAVLGHEMVGEVVAMGPGGARDWRGRQVASGARVTWSMVWSCGECFYCRRDLHPKCERLLKFGHERIQPDRALFGGMAEYCWLPERTAVFPIPDRLPDAVAAPANCATATVAAVFRHAASVHGETVVILGAGMLGLTASAMAAEYGAEQVLVIEPDEGRRVTALRFGAAAAIDSALPPTEIVHEVERRTAGRGADAVLELSGNPDAVELALSLLRPGGRLIMAGSTFPSRPAQCPAERVVRQLLRISGVYNYVPADLGTALEFLDRAAGRYPFEELVGAVFPLHDVNQAIAFAETKRPPRVALIPSPSKETE
jgi:putative phosphonate catabolism associated alcohol dehydrogenase